MTFAENFASRLRYVRHQQGMNQSETARLAGISRQTFMQLENGNSEPRFSTAIALAAALGVNIELLAPPHADTETED